MLDPIFVKDKNVICANCGKEFCICHAPDASNEKKKSSAIGEPPNNGPSQMDVLTRLLTSLGVMTSMIRIQSDQITELTRGMEYLAQQVKTLVDALAEDEDPDQPITNYLSGKPI